MKSSSHSSKRKGSAKMTKSQENVPEEEQLVPFVYQTEEMKIQAANLAHNSTIQGNLHLGIRQLYVVNKQMNFLSCSWKDRKKSFMGSQLGMR